MLLNTEELLAVVNGDAEPDRLADLLDRLEHCPDSAAALQVLVTLRANREEALEALRVAAGNEPAPAPHPAARKMMLNGWALQGLRMAASIALVALIGMWALSSPISSFFAGVPVSIVDLATTEFQSDILTSPPGLQLTSAGEEIDRAHELLRDGRYAEARSVLEDLDPDDQHVALFLGMSEYFLGAYLDAAEILEGLRMSHIEDSHVRMQAFWYEANALLKLDRGIEAAVLLATVRAQPPNSKFQEEAAAKYAEVAGLLGMKNPGYDSAGR